MKKAIMLTVCLCLPWQTCLGDMTWYDPIEHGAQVHGHGWPELYGTYRRLPDYAEDVVSPGLWSLSKHSAGLSIVFRSDSPVITVRYKVGGGLSMFHMPSTGVSGIDLYAVDSEGKVRWCFPKFPATVKEEGIQYRYSSLVYHPDSGRYYEYHLYLPLYNSVEKLEIGVEDGSMMEFLPVSTEKPIVVYGTSIAQGACASRPGNAFTNIIDRELGHPVVNLGFSGSGKLEPGVFRLLAEIDAKMYVIDCMPNMEGIPDSICVRMLRGIDILRAAHDCPILLVEHSGCKSEVCDSVSILRHRTDCRLAEAVKALQNEGVPGIHLITENDISMPQDGMVEGTHPNDLGMRALADAYEKAIREILRYHDR